MKDLPRNLNVFVQAIYWKSLKEFLERPSAFDGIEVHRCKLIREGDSNLAEQLYEPLPPGDNSITFWSLYVHYSGQTGLLCLADFYSQAAAVRMCSDMLDELQSLRNGDLFPLATCDNKSRLVPQNHPWLCYRYYWSHNPTNNTNT